MPASTCRRRDERGRPVTDQQWPCPTCAQETVFEQPSCVDGHTEDGGECPEWACVDCGTALVIGDVHRPTAESWHRAA